MTCQTAEQRPVSRRTRPGLIVREDSTSGTYVVKDPISGKFFQIGEQERYLLFQLDGEHDGPEICAAFEVRFREPLSGAELQEFVDLAGRRGLLDDPAGLDNPQVSGGSTREAGQSLSRRFTGKQELLYWRIPFFDPDRLLGWLESRMRFVWTGGFVMASVGLMAVAAVIALLNQAHWMSAFPAAITWKTVATVWILIFIVTLIHEFAHGLTCKHHGGEVHEIGFLLLFFIPCFYCNVSDAWLFRERSKRLWVGAAGAFSDLVTWAVATILWRITAPETSINYCAWMIATVCGGRCFFNFNPLMKLDGYYVLSDAMQIPNLFDRGRRRWMQTLRWILWGGRRPQAEPHGTFLLVYGLASWLFIAAIFWGMVYGLLHLQSRGFVKLGLISVSMSVWMTILIGKNLFRDLFAEEFAKMFTKRRGRLLSGLLVLMGISALANVIPLQDRVTGTFSVRPSTRVEISSIDAGFLQEIQLAEGSQVSPGSEIARIAIPDLEVNFSKKLAEIRESEANLRRLEVGPRPEEVAEQKLRVERAKDWVTLGKQDLSRAQKSFEEQILQIEQLTLQHEAEVELGNMIVKNAERLHGQKAMSGEQLLNERTKFKIASLKLDHSRAEKRSREAEGTVAAESELAKREKELADETSKLNLLEAGGRLEEVEAERARLARLTEERKYLDQMRSRTVLRSPVAGVISTPRMHEKNGQYVLTGTVVCVVEDLSNFIAEIAVSESSVLKVKPGQLVELRARGMPMQSIKAKVERSAPVATSVLSPNAPQIAVLPGNVIVYCRLSQSDANLLSGMTGYARIYGEQRTIGKIALDSVIRNVRTEFWFW